ncbi:MAG: hypothetical protein ACUVSK_04775, partial [Desulfotomaculales bacterium]
CVIALVRSALEGALLQANIDYPGSVFFYLARLREQHPDVYAFWPGNCKRRSASKRGGQNKARKQTGGRPASLKKLIARPKRLTRSFIAGSIDIQLF